MNSKVLKGNLMLLAASVIGGVGIIGNKELINLGFDTFEIIAGRFFVASLFSVILFNKKLKGIKKEELMAGGLMGVFLFGVFALMVIGLKYTSSSVSGFLINLQAVFVPVICFLVYRQKPDFNSVIGVILTAVGMALLCIEDGFNINLGAMITVFGSVCMAFQIVVTGNSVKKYDPLRLTVTEYFTVFVLALIFTAFKGSQLKAVTPYAALIFLIIGLVSTLIYFVLQSYGQQYTTETSASILISSEAIFTALISAVFMNEYMKARMYLGGGIIFAAIIITQVKKEDIKRIMNREKSFENI